MGKVFDRDGAYSAQPDAKLRWQPGPLIGFPCDLRKAHLPIGAFDAEHAVLELDIRCGSLQHPAGELLALFHYLVRRQLERGAAGDHAALGKGAATKKDPVGIPLKNTHLVEAHPQPFGDHLGEHRLVTLSVRVRADMQGERPIWCHTDFHSFGLTAGALAMQGKSDAAAQTAPLALGAARRKPGPIGELKGLVQDALEFSRIVDIAARGRVRHGRGMNEIAPANLNRVDAHFAGGLVDEALDHEPGFRFAGAAIRRHHARVGKHCAYDDMDERHIVGAGITDCGIVWSDAGGVAEVGADVHRNRYPQGQYAAFGIERELRFSQLMASVRVGCETFAALSVPFHGPIKLAGRPDDQCLLRIDLTLHAESAAHIRRNHSQVEVRNAKRGGQGFPHTVRGLRARVKHVPVGRRIAIGYGRPRLDSICCHARIMKRKFRHVGSVRKFSMDRVTIAAFELKTHIAIGLVPNLRRVGSKRVGERHCRYRLVFHGKAFGGVLCLA